MTAPALTAPALTAFWHALPLAAILAAAAVAQPAPAQTQRHDSEPVSAEKFACSDGLLLTLARDPGAGLLRGLRAGEPFVLHQQVTRGRQRFVNGSDSIVFDGDSLLLQRGRSVRQTCRRLPDQATEGVVWGTVSAADGKPFAAGTTVKVLLADSMQEAMPAIEVASTVLRTSGNQPPFWFVVRYDPYRIASADRLQLLARVETAKGDVLYQSGLSPVFSLAVPPAQPVELQLVAVGN